MCEFIHALDKWNTSLHIIYFLLKVFANNTKDTVWEVV